MDLKSTKRIAVLVARNNFVYRGVGAYVKSILDYALAEGYHVDIISDDECRDNGLFDAYQSQVQWFYPVTIAADKHYKELSAFSRPFDVTLVLNFRNSLLRALRKHSYDAVVTNVGEALAAVTSIGLHHCTPVLHPTHHESEAGLKVRHDIFSPGVCDIYRGLCGMPQVVLACQSEFVRDAATAQYSTKDKDEIVVIPPFVPELGLLDFVTLPKERWGVGFIGPWEPRKNPEAYILALRNSGLPGVVLVPSDVSAKKFKEAFTKYDIEHKIYVGITGAEKVAAIQSMAAAYHPAVSETFGLGALETAHSCATILLKKNDWSSAHSEYAEIVDEADVPALLQQVYGQGISSQQQKKLIARHESIVRNLNSFLDVNAETKSKNNLTEAVTTQGIVHHAGWVDAQPSFCTDEIYKLQKLCASRNVIETLHSKTDTYYRLRGTNALPVEEGSALFSFG